MSPSRRGTSVSFERTHAAAKQYVGLKQKQLCFSLRLRPEKISNIRRGNIQGWKRRRARSTERKFMLRHVDAEIYTDRSSLSPQLAIFLYIVPWSSSPFPFHLLSPFHWCTTAAICTDDCATSSHGTILPSNRRKETEKGATRVRKFHYNAEMRWLTSCHALRIRLGIPF